MNNDVILVDEYDNMIGTMQKLQAHLAGELHRAFSVFIFNSNGELLLQQRAFNKYHSGGKWTNTCCSHPNPGETTFAAANRRLNEEMGMSAELHYAFNFIYKAELLDGISEYEFDHVFIGVSDSEPVPDPGEVATVKYVNPTALTESIHANPEDYSAWLKICLERVMDCYQLMF